MADHSAHGAGQNGASGAGTGKDGARGNASPSAQAAAANDPAALEPGRADAPEAVNRSQMDDESQAQTVADDALERATAVLGAEGDEAGESDRAPDGAYEDGHSEPDLVETMDAMVSSGRIDTGAYAGERDDDEEADTLGEAGREPGERH